MSKDLKLLINEHKWERAIELVKADPSAAKKRYALHAFVNEYQDTSDVYPIHHACSIFDVPLELIQALLHAFPASIDKTEARYHRSCLHIALLKNLSDEIISYLIDAKPDIVQTQDLLGRVPLHYACSNTRSSDILKKIIMPFPQCVRAPDVKMWTPFHVAVTKNTHPDVIEFMLNVCPEAVSMQNEKGSLPLKLLMDGQDYGNRDRIVEIITKKDAEFDELPEWQNLRNATVHRPQTPVKMKSYCYV
jgi:ankyrin repeat protein